MRMPSAVDSVYCTFPLSWKSERNCPCSKGRNTVICVYWLTNSRPIAVSSVSNPSPVLALIKIACGSVIWRISSLACSSKRSILLNTVKIGISPAPISCSVPKTVRCCSMAFSWAASTMCTSKSASVISSSVARKAAINWVGSFWINPTVSVSKTACPLGNSSCRVVGSKVAKSWSAT